MVLMLRELGLRKIGAGNTGKEGRYNRPNKGLLQIYQRGIESIHILFV